MNYTDKNKWPMKETSWKMCQECHGRGTKSRKLRKNVKRQYQLALEVYENNGEKGIPPARPNRHLDVCSTCNGSGLLPAATPPTVDTDIYPHVAIIGAGIGGVALAVACLHRQIPFTLYERDKAFDLRSQGYGLTLQQASKAMEGFGISALEDGVVSTRHVVHTTDGSIIGEWGMRKWMQGSDKVAPKHTNIHIARQALRSALMAQLGGHSAVQWGHQLIGFEKCQDKSVDLNFDVDGKTICAKADLVVGADGIRSAVRSLLIDEAHSPLHYLGCIVILGICSLSALESVDSSLLDSATVFQTANGHERIYMMPFTTDSVMWQLSFPMHEDDAKALSAAGPLALKDEALKRTQWHTPVPQIVAATQVAQVSGYPVYDRALLEPEILGNAGAVTLLGDAAHPMSPFKGQGANQALLDALALARSITKGCGPFSQWRDGSVRECVLSEFESNMLKRTAVKVKDSAAAAEFLHSDIVLHVGDGPRGRWFNREDE